MAVAKKDHEEAMAAAKKDHEQVMASSKKDHEEAMAVAKKDHEEAMAASKKDHEESVMAMKRTHEAERHQWKLERAELMKPWWQKVLQRISCQRLIGYMSVHRQNLPSYKSNQSPPDYWDI